MNYHNRKLNEILITYCIIMLVSVIIMLAGLKIKEKALEVKQAQIEQIIKIEQMEENSL